MAPRFLTSVLDEGKWLASRLVRFTPEGKDSDIYRIGGWMGPRNGHVAMENKKSATIKSQIYVFQPEAQSPYCLSSFLTISLKC
jgi:hypothetical protein